MALLTFLSNRSSSSFRANHSYYYYNNRSTCHRIAISWWFVWSLVSTSPSLFGTSSSRRTVSCLARSFVLPSIRSKSTTAAFLLDFPTSSSLTSSSSTGLFTATTSTITTKKDPQQTIVQSNTTNNSNKMDAPTKLAKLRERMKELDYDVYLIPTDDPHLSEYVPDAYKRREFLTEFRGSAGTAVVTQDDIAYVWTDSRYWNEASLQLDASIWNIQKVGLPDTPTIPKWLADHAYEFWKKKKSEDHRPLKIAMDPYVHPASFVKEVQEEMEKIMREEETTDETSINNMPGQLIPEYNNLIDEIWGTDRPNIPTSPFRIHPIEYAGTSVEAKVAQIRKEMQTKKATIAVFSTLDDVAYLCNLRAQGDIDTCPVGIGYAIVTLDNVFLYCHSDKIVNIQEYLQTSNITHKPYDQIVPDLQSWTSNDPHTKVWIDKSRTNYAIVNVIPEKQLIDAQNAITPMKAVKNAAELEGMREAHIVDGVAMAHFMAWLEEQIVQRNRTVSEVEIDQVLTGFRAQQPGFAECSFPTIAGVGSNGAIIHYRASESDPLLKYLDRSTSLLLDSGGQYLYGTTDVTRTWSFQETPDPKFCDYYTRVLKGNIGLDRMIFPENTPGFVLDTYARRWLWDIQADYGHGTGHGVGAALNVHEGPMSISPRWANKEVLKPGMVISNEPGYYEDGNFGIRIENLIEVAYVNPEDATPKEEGDAAEAPKSSKKKFFKFQKLTMIPIQKNLINVDIMTKEELDWLDAYHADVLEKVGSRLEEGSPAMEWLKKSCEKIDRTRTS